jgi:LmbE family N-acetylglucosaminyl deacetylase
MKVLVIAPHPDDEVLGMGGTIAKHADRGDEVSVAVVSEGVSAQYSNPKMLEVRRTACKKAGKLLGVQNFVFHDLPDGRLMESGLVEITRVINEAIRDYSPEIMYAPDRSELHMDHRMVHEAALVVTRPYLDSFQRGTICFYETSNLKHSAFDPNHYVDISSFIETKIEAFKLYESEVEEFPHPRSLDAIKTIARFRGAEAGVQYAEGFVLGRRVC